MASVNIAAAPSGAAILPTAGADGRSSAAAGFAAVFASAQATAGAIGGGTPAADTPGDDAASAMPPGGKGDAQLAAWLTMTRLAQQLTGTATLNLANGDAKTPSRDLGPAATSDAPTDTAKTPDSAASAQFGILSTIVALAPAPTVLPAGAAVGAETPVTGADDAGTAIADPQAEANATAADLAAAVLTALDDAVASGANAEASGHVDHQSQANAESAVRTPPDPQSIKALLAELKNTPAPGLASGSSEGAADDVSNIDPSSGLTAAVGQAMRGKAAQGDRRGSGESNRDRAAAETLLDARSRPAAGLARAIAARFQANEGDAPVNAVATAPIAGRLTAETAEGTKHATPIKYGSADGSAFMTVPASTSAASVIGRTAVVTPAAPVSAIAGEVAADLHSQIIQGMRMQATAHGGDAQIRLQPEYLGDLSISLKVENGAVTARLAASSADVRQWIEANEPLLRQSLAQQDLRLEKLVVAEDEPASSNHEQEPAQEQAGHQPRPRRRRPENEATFEVVV